MTFSRLENFDLRRLTPRASRLICAKLDSNLNEAVAGAVRDALTDRDRAVNLWLPKLSIDDARSACKFFCSLANSFDRRSRLFPFGQRDRDLAMLFCVAIAATLRSQIPDPLAASPECAGNGQL